MKLKPLLTTSLEDRLALYSHIELTEDEQKEAILAGKQKKLAAIKQQEYWKKVNEEPVFIKLTAE